ncbi:Mediator of RNA polymerase II transcription subunit [Drechslerella dactyloides]|uniref:Mediator of RNA polymerase II transcription subunit 18 n=1 Tax=Drechslerella dactyloides TaxID=74499 RepID=A0AAD6IRC9_DREDA|nr:Mediator of RNA polymerase II transcription subunit [Drechslerella dactyloides]
MHELTLFAHVPNSRVAQVRRALTTITGMPAVPLLEHHLLYKPKRSRQTASGSASASGGAGPGGSAAAGDFYYLKLIADILGSGDQTGKGSLGRETHHVDGENTRQGGDAMELDPRPPASASEVSESTNSKEETLDRQRAPSRDDAYDIRKQKWAIRFSDLPEVNNKRPVTSRMVHQATVSDGDALSFVECLGYMFLSEYILSGYYFTHHNIYVTLTRTLLPRQPFTPFPGVSLESLDPADSYILQASIKVSNANEQEAMNKGVEELKTLRNELKGVVDLEENYDINPLTVETGQPIPHPSSNVLDNGTALQSNSKPGYFNEDTKFKYIKEE